MHTITIPISWLFPAFLFYPYPSHSSLLYNCPSSSSSSSSSFVLPPPPPSSSLLPLPPPSSSSSSLPPPPPPPPSCSSSSSSSFFSFFVSYLLLKNSEDALRFFLSEAEEFMFLLIAILCESHICTYTCTCSCTFLSTCKYTITTCYHCHWKVYNNLFPLAGERFVKGIGDGVTMSDTLKREIIHKLLISPLPHSQILKEFVHIVGYNHTHVHCTCAHVHKHVHTHTLK